MLANTVPVVPSAHCVGIAPRLAAYAAQFGVGAATPTQASCCTALGKPGVVERRADRLRVRRALEDADAAAHHRARAARTAPWNAAICGAVPYVHEKPTRGLR